MARLILASASPRRRDLLRRLGVRFTVVVSGFDESTLSHLTDGAEYVLRAAESKAAEVATRRNGLILGVDTDVVSPDGVILGKPGSPDEAAAMLRTLSGRTHTVHSGVALLAVEKGVVVRAETRLVSTRVRLAQLPDAAIAAYVATGEPMDKAGGYGMQGHAMAFVKRVDGDPSNVIGLPLWCVAELLESFGHPLWNFARLSSS